jgi:hypothetical protein
MEDKTMLSRFVLPPVLVGALTQPALSQSVPVTGDSVRVSAEQYGLEEQVGVVRAIGSNRLEVALPGDDTAVGLPLSAVSQLERRVEKRRTKLGAMIGGALGASLGAIIGNYQETRTCVDNVWLFCTRQKTETKGLGGVLLGATVGGAIGALVGSRFRYGSWVESDVVGTAPSGASGGGGLGVSATLRF